MLRLLVLCFLVLSTGAAMAQPTAVFFGPQEWMSERWYKTLADALSEHGMRVVSIDIPCHGNLDCWKRTADGNPSWIGQYLDGIESQIPQDAVVIGDSRAGFIALAAAARFDRVKLVVAMSPVVELARLTEFKGVGADLYGIAAKLAERAVFIEIGASDDRVGTEPAIKLARAISAAKPLADVTLIVAPANGHTEPDGTFANAAAWIERRLH